MTLGLRLTISRNLSRRSLQNLPSRSLLARSSQLDVSGSESKQPRTCRKYSSLANVGEARDVNSTREYFESLKWLPDATRLKVEDRPESQNFIVQDADHGMTLELPYIYLRDSCLCNQCRHPATKQRLLDTFSISSNIKPRSWALLPEGLTIQWNDNHNSYYSREWFQARHKPLDASDIWLQRSRKWYNPKTSLEAPSVGYESIMTTKDGLRKHLNLIAEYGFCFVDDCPVDPDATQRLLERIAFIRLTHYGGFFDFTSDLSMKDTAYTDIALDLHNDTTYFSDPIGILMLHLLSHTEGQGGMSTLVDGFEVADVLRQQSHSDFEALSKISIRGHASGDQNIGSIMSVSQAETVIGSVNHPGGANRQNSTYYNRIRWNNSDRAAWPASKSSDEIQQWYNAAKAFNSLVNEPKYLWQFQLEPGRPLIFDNWRMLHGRTAFTGKRRMAGGYLNMDDFVAKWKQLNLDHAQILQSI